MNKRRIAPIIISAVLLTACGGAPEHIDPLPEPVTEEATTTAETTRRPAPTTAAPTETTEETTTTTEAPTEPPVMECREVLEVYETIKMQDFITKTNVTLADPEVTLNTTVIGEYTVDVPYLVGEGEEAKTETLNLHYNVVDTAPPVIINNGADAAVQTGSAFDLNSLVGYGDNYDAHPSLTYTGTVDTSAVGNYPVTATVTDSSGNSVSWDLTVRVMDAVPPESNADEPRVDFADFMASYAGPGRRFGIDVSRWQGNIDWNAVKAAGCSFVLMRIGYGDSGITPDENYQANMSGAKAAGLDVGVYFYSTASTPEQARYQADWIAAQLNEAELAFPVAFDWESFKTFQKYGMSLHDLNALYAAFKEELAQYHYDTMLYASRDRLGEAWQNPDSETVWLAHYTQDTNYTGKYALWQQSNTGRISGIAGDVDMNVQMGE